MRFLFNSSDANRVAKCLGFAYLIHSAYFITDEATSLHNGIRYFVLLFYFAGVFVISRVTFDNTYTVKKHLAYFESHGMHATFGQALTLKLRILQWNYCFTLIYSLGILFYLLQI